MREAFGIAGGAQVVANNGVVIATLEDGSQGVGEAAPFPAVNGETQAAVEHDLLRVLPSLEGLVFSSWRDLDAVLPAFPDTPTASTALEMALIDATLRCEGQSLWSACGARERELRSDITIGTGSIESARQSAVRAGMAGFDCLKVKVGSKLEDTESSLDQDAERLDAIAGAAPGARLLLDGNAAYSAQDALRLLARVRHLVPRIALFEQPTPKQDLRGLREVQERGGIAVAADESCQGVETLEELAGVAVVNVKLMKSGVLGALRLIERARALGFGLMMGGMVESRLAMGTAASIAAGHGGFDFIDLDTPLWLAEDPCSEGYTQSGPIIEVPTDALGHGTRIHASWLER
ncbi:MAG: dipeptide epimerase [Polyangiaceae bacterium]